MRQIEELKNLVADNVKKIRLARKFNRRILGEKIGVSVVRVGHIEGAKHPLGLETMAKLAVGLECDVLDFLDPELNTRIESFKPLEEDHDETLRS